MAYHTGTQQLLCDIDDGVATFTFSRPEKKNALSGELTATLRQGLHDLELRPDVHAIMLTGAGAAFCSGGDISGMGGGTPKQNNPSPTQAERARSLQRSQSTLALRIQQLDKPSIGRSTWGAAGAGLSIALACDLRVATQSAFITTAFRNSGLSGD